VNPALQSVLEHPAIWRGGDLPPAAQPALSSGFPALDAQLPGGGWPVGALTEILADADGMGELSLLLPFLSRLTRAGQGVVWVAPPYLPYAPALAAAGVEPERCLVVMTQRPWGDSPLSLTHSPSPGERGELRARVERVCKARGERRGAAGPKLDCGRNAIWVMEQALRSGACGAVLAWLDDTGIGPDYRALRCLQLAAEAGGATGFLYRPSAVARMPSPAPLRLSLSLEEAHLAVRILKRRSAAACAPLRLAVQGLRWRGLRADAEPALPPSGRVLPLQAETRRPAQTNPLHAH
jgi:hypothetical protein